MKEKIGFWLLNPASKFESILLALLFVFLPTQLGKHFWPDFSSVSGIRVDYLSPTLYFTDSIILLLLFLTLKRIGVAGILHFIKTNIFLLLSLAFFLETVLFGVRPLLGLYWWSKLCLMVFFAYYLLHNIRQFSQILFISLLFAVSSFFQSLLAILQYISQSSLNGWLYYLGERTFTGTTPGIANASIDGLLLLRPYGTFSHPNVLAGYLLLSSIIVYFLLVRYTKGFIRFFGIIVVCLNSIALLLTLSRIVIVLWFVLLCSLIFTIIVKRQSLRKGVAIAAIGGITVSIFVMPFMQILITRFSESTFTEEAVVQRAQLMVSALQIIKEHPITGVGLGNFIPVLDTIQSPLTFGLYLQPVHNIYLLLLAESGILGFLLFICLFVLTLLRLATVNKNNLKIKKLYGIFALLLFCILFIGLFDHYFLTLQQGMLLFACVIGLCWATIKKTN